MFFATANCLGLESDELMSLTYDSWGETSSISRLLIVFPPRFFRALFFLLGNSGYCMNFLFRVACMFGQISGHRLVATVDGWVAGHVFPFGHYVTSLGPVGEVRLSSFYY